MILGLSDTEKKFKTAMDTAGADMTVVNSWLKLYVKTKKNDQEYFSRCGGAASDILFRRQDEWRGTISAMVNTHNFRIIHYPVSAGNPKYSAAANPVRQKSVAYHGMGHILAFPYHF